MACLFHFNAAGLFNQAALVMIQVLMAFIEQEASIQDEWGLTSLWAYSALPREIDVNLRLNICALQLAVLDGRGRDIGPVLADLNSLFREAGENGTGHGDCIFSNCDSVSIANIRC